MKSTDLASSLSEYAISISPKNLSNEVIQEAKRKFIDTIGCAIGAFDAKPVKISKKVAERVSSNYSATIFGTNIKTSVDLATFVNGAMIRYLDYNDTYLSKDPGHPSDNLSAVIAVGEAEESTGLDIITAAVVAYEIQCRLCDALAIRVKGWDHVTYGGVSSSLAVAKLMGLSIEKTAHALSLSLIASIAMRQTRSGQISMWKACAFSNAARNAVFACMLAKEGMTGPAPIFEGEEGFFKLVSGPISMNIEEFGGRGGKFKILETSIKYYPSEYHSQSAVEAAIELHKMLKGRFEEIDEVLIETFEASYKIIGSGKEKWEPKSRETADHSLPYCVSVALMDGTLNLDSFKEEKLRDPKLLS
ncbi:MAG: MmgE/PrpD family protein, partial [Nitrososphaerales archaeon]